jgi:hypothetical protein
MAILKRLAGTEQPKLPVHQWMAGLAEVKRGHITQAQFISAFSLSPAEVTELATWASRLTGGSIARDDIHDVLMLLEYGLYSEAQAKNRLVP